PRGNSFESTKRLRDRNKSAHPSHGTSGTTPRPDRAAPTYAPSWPARILDPTRRATRLRRLASALRLTDFLPEERPPQLQTNATPRPGWRSHQNDNLACLWVRRIRTFGCRRPPLHPEAISGPGISAPPGAACAATAPPLLPGATARPRQRSAARPGSTC